MNLTHRRKHYVRGVGSRCPWEMQQIQPLFPSEFLGTDSDHGQHGKMLLGEASLVYWFMNRSPGLLWEPSQVFAILEREEKSKEQSL